MAGRLTVEQIVSADGYAAEPDGGISFMSAVDEPDPSDADQMAFLDEVDAILLGATTYRMFAEYWPKADPAVEPVAEPIARIPKFVVSNTLQSAPWGTGEIEVLAGNPVAAVDGLKRRTESIVVWGSLTLTDALFRAGLVDALRLRTVPVLIGAGRPFTPPDLGERRLHLDHSVAHPSGHVGTTYVVR
ncbi:dihydrofolate reductase family protein [Agromyces sp. NPDC058110]|uniref:dihydrofolate reductase family protein n=1 Tax=Agromyces sp. NPDC058110 TaxID=3346345 RepID=UPI0036DA8F3F